MGVQQPFVDAAAISVPVVDISPFTKPEEHEDGHRAARESTRPWKRNGGGGSSRRYLISDSPHRGGVANCPALAFSPLFRSAHTERLHFSLSRQEYISHSCQHQKRLSGPTQRAMSITWCRKSKISISAFMKLHRLQQGTEFALA